MLHVLAFHDRPYLDEMKIKLQNVLELKRKRPDGTEPSVLFLILT